MLLDNTSLQETARTKYGHPLYEDEAIEGMIKYFKFESYEELSRHLEKIDRAWIDDGMNY